MFYWVTVRKSTETLTLPSTFEYIGGRRNQNLCIFLFIFIYVSLFSVWPWQSAGKAEWQLRLTLLSFQCIYSSTFFITTSNIYCFPVFLLNAEVFLCPLIFLFTSWRILLALGLVRHIQCWVCFRFSVFREKLELLFCAALQGFKWELYVQLWAEIPHFRWFKVDFGSGVVKHKNKLMFLVWKKCGYDVFHWILCLCYHEVKHISDEASWFLNFWDLKYSSVLN